MVLILAHFYCSANGNFVLELDFEPFTASFPRIGGVVVDEEKKGRG